ncbi:MAG: regulatory protein RecX [Burkholderiales bacterium]|nr:regulatory protein RecX [Burkholderiales bacterium]
MELLAARDHSRFELSRKLIAKGHDPGAVESALADLTRDGWLDERRFVEGYVRARAGRGFGPVRIAHELRERGIDSGLIAVQVDEGGHDWRERLRAVRHKRFGAAPPKDFKDRARQARFLEYRGFAPEQIRSVLNED